MIRRLILCLALILIAAISPASAQQPPFSQAITFQDAATAAGNGNVLSTGNFTVLGLQVVKTGTSVGTVNPEGSVGASSTWTAIPCYPQGSSTASTAPNSGIFRCSVIGVTRVRMRLSSVTPGTGTISVYGFATQLGPMPVNVP